MEMQLLVLFKVCTTSLQIITELSNGLTLFCTWSVRELWPDHWPDSNCLRQPGTEAKARCWRGRVPSKTQGEVPPASPAEHSYEEVAETEPTRAEIYHPTEYQAPPTPTETTATAVP
eukprot:sb/3476522/